MMEKLEIPEGVERVESGVVQFGDDWPGVFIRGDHALYYARCLDAITNGEPDEGEAVLLKAVVQGLINSLNSCNASNV